MCDNFEKNIENVQITFKSVRKSGSGSMNRLLRRYVTYVQNAVLAGTKILDLEQFYWATKDIEKTSSRVFEKHIKDLRITESLNIK